jgi:hypothetical protein
MRRRGITDRLALAYWREYQVIVREGNPLGISFVEYVAARVNAEGEPKFAYNTTASSNAPWYMAACGHAHPWGASCSTWTMT